MSEQFIEEEILAEEAQSRKGRRARREPSFEPPPEPTTAKPPRQPRGKQADLNRLRRDLKKSVNALSLLPFMAKGTADRLLNPDVVKVLDEKAEAFADAWVAVAEQNEMVRANLSRLLASGVWLNAGAQTAAFGYVLAVFSGFAPLHPGAVMVLPDMAKFVYVPTPPEAAANGGTAAPEGSTAEASA